MSAINPRVKVETPIKISNTVNTAEGKFPVTAPVLKYPKSTLLPKRKPPIRKKEPIPKNVSRG
jgi:hypothetical protein